MLSRLTERQAVLPDGDGTGQAMWQHKPT